MVEQLVDGSGQEDFIFIDLHVDFLKEGPREFDFQ